MTIGLKERSSIVEEFEEGLVQLGDRIIEFPSEFDESNTEKMFSWLQGTANRCQTPKDGTQIR